MARFTLLFILLCLEASVAELPNHALNHSPNHAPNRQRTYHAQDDVLAPRNVPNPKRTSNDQDEVLAPRNVPDRQRQAHDKNYAHAQRNLPDRQRQVSDQYDVFAPRNVLDRELTNHGQGVVLAPRNVKDHKRQAQEQDDAIAFSAELSEEFGTVSDRTILFDKVLTNVGGLYFNSTGQFVCPDEGLYVFVWNLRKATATELPEMRCFGSLRSGGVDRKYGPKTSYFSTSGAYTGITEMTAVLQCSNTTLTAVTITSQPWTEGTTTYSVFHPDSSFSGFRLQESVAFTAEALQNQSLIEGSRIKFDNVLSNYGGFYDVINSYFRCPDAGVYVFSVSTHTRDPNTPWSVSRLMVEGEVVMQGPITYIATEEYDSGSASSNTVLQCTPGLSIYVEAQAAYDFPYNSYGKELTSFTGFKLYDVSSETVAFTAVLTQNFTGSDYEEPIPFDQVITNIGNAFDISTSSFVCPDDAYYLFTWSAVTRVDDFSNMDLYLDGSLVKQLRTTMPASSVSTSGTCTQSVILQCQPGSVLQTVTNWPNELFLGGYTSFSGYKLPG